VEGWHLAARISAPILRRVGNVVAFFPPGGTPAATEVVTHGTSPTFIHTRPGGASPNKLDQTPAADYHSSMTWAEACNDKSLHDLPYKVELNRQGKIIMSPTRNTHGYYQGEITHLLRTLLPHGSVIVECAIDTSEGTYVADVTWVSADRFKILKDELSSSIAPEICVEVWSPSNSPEELEMKRRLYFGKGAIEFWYCDAAGFITCHDTTGVIHQSRLCPQFPRQVG
jgi:Uma2 family endonuclease